MTALELIEARNAMAVIVALIGFSTCIAYVVTPQRRKAKKPVYLLVGLGFLYLAIVYLSTFFTSLYAVRSGWASVIGMTLLMFAVIAIIITDWRISSGGENGF